MTEPLDAKDRARVYGLQLWLGCTKRCPRCGQQRPMTSFEDDERLYLNCAPCRMRWRVGRNGKEGRRLVRFDSDADMERWFAELKAKTTAAVGAAR